MTSCRCWGQAKTRGKSGSAINQGFGFWDRNWPKKVGKAQKLAKKGGKGSKITQPVIPPNLYCL